MLFNDNINILTSYDTIILINIIYLIYVNINIIYYILILYYVIL